MPSSMEFYSTRRVAAHVPIALQQAAREILVSLRHTGLERSDLLLGGYPRSGGTWVRFMTLSALTGAAIDFAVAESLCPPVGSQKKAPRIVAQPESSVSGRVIKTHEQARFAKRFRGKALYVVRDPRDVAISYYHFLTPPNCVRADELDRFAKSFAAGKIGPYGSWQSHVRGWRAFSLARPHDAVIVRYEDLLQDAPATLVDAFARIRIPVEACSISAAVDRSSADSMRRKESTIKDATDGIRFVRAARAEQWRECLTAATVSTFASVARSELTLFGYSV